MSAEFLSSTVISVMNHLVSEEVFLGFRTSFSRQGSENWLPEVTIDVSQAVGKATLEGCHPSGPRSCGLERSRNGHHPQAVGRVSIPPESLEVGKCDLTPSQFGPRIQRIIAVFPDGRVQYEWRKQQRQA